MCVACLCLAKYDQPCVFSRVVQAIDGPTFSVNEPAAQRTFSDDRQAIGKQTRLIVRRVDKNYIETGGASSQIPQCVTRLNVEVDGYRTTQLFHLGVDGLTTISLHINRRQ